MNDNTRRVLFSAVNSTATGSTGFGEFSTVGAYARFSGVIDIRAGSATVRYRMGPQSGNYIVSSTFVANSGGSVFDVLNYGRTADFGFTAANSTLFSIVIFGQPQR